MKRKKLKLHRETLRSLETREIQEAQGGAFTETCVSCYRSQCTCGISCGGTCDHPSCFNLC